MSQRKIFVLIRYTTVISKYNQIKGDKQERQDKKMELNWAGPEIDECSHCPTALTWTSETGGKWVTWRQRREKLWKSYENWVEVFGWNQTCGQRQESELEKVHYGPKGH